MAEEQENLFNISFDSIQDESLIEIDDSTGEDVVVDNSERGKGVGTKLTRKLLEEAKKAGVNFVDVNTRRPDAKAFYEKLGFTDKTKDRPFYSLRYYF